MSVINTNYLALVSQNNLTKSQNALGTAIERLSSGLRINSAKDDAAGQAIANRFTANIKGLTQAARNANDGISIAQTTEGALNEINNNLQRIRELSVQAQNGTNSPSDLKSIQDEITQRLGEIDRVSQQTQFNGVKVLATGEKLTIQVGAHDNQTIDIELKKIDSTTLGLNTFRVDGDVAATGAKLAEQFKGDITGNFNYEVDGVTYKVDVSSGDVTRRNVANDADVDVFVTNSGKLVVEAEADFQGAWVSGLAAEGAGVAANGTFTYDGVTWTSTGGADANGNGTFTASIGGQSVTITIANSGDADGAGAEATVDAGTLYVDDNAAATSVTTIATKAAESNLVDQVNNGKKTGGELVYGGNTYFVDAEDAVRDQANNRIYIQNAGTHLAALVTQDDAVQSTTDPLAALDRALSQVDSLRSELGAVQNRFQSTIANLSNTVNNLSAARSRIEDADYAVEVSNMTRAQILQQAGTSVLAQANQVPQGVLSLLR